MAALHEERQRLLSVIDAAQVGTWEWNVQTGATVFNARWAGIIGYTLEELQPVSIETWNRLVHPDDLRASAQNLNRHFTRETEYYETEARMRHKHGAWVWVLDRGRVVSWTLDGKPLLMRGTHTDISRQKRLEEALIDRERESSTLMQNLPGMTYRSRDPSRPWCLDFVSDGAVALTGYPKAALLQGGGTTFADLVHELDRAAAENEMQSRLRRGEPYVLQYRLRTSTGHEKWVWEHGSGIPDNQGRLRGIEALVLDITAQRQAEEELRRSETRFRALIEHAPDGVVLVSAQGVMTFASPAARRMFGYSSEDVRSISPNDSTHPEDLPGVLQALELLMREPHQVQTLSYRFRHRNGRWIWIESVFTNLLGVPGVDAIVINFRDVDDRKQAEAALRSSEERFRTLVETAPEAIFIQTQECFAYANTAALALFRAESVEELVGTPVLDRFHPDYREQVRERIRRLNEEGLAVEAVDEVCLTLKGTSRDVSVSAVPFFHQGSRGALVFARDISERKQAEYKLANQVEELRRWHAVTLGRERRVLELKSEVNALLAEREQPPRYSSAVGPTRDDLPTGGVRRDRDRLAPAENMP